MSREELEKAIYNLVSNDNEIMSMNTDEDIRRTLRLATLTQLCEFWEEAKEAGFVC